MPRRRRLRARSPRRRLSHRPFHASSHPESSATPRRPACRNLGSLEKVLFKKPPRVLRQQANRHSRQDRNGLQQRGGGKSRAARVSIHSLLRGRMKCVPGRKQGDDATGIQCEGGTQRRSLSSRRSRIDLPTCSCVSGSVPGGATATKREPSRTNFTFRGAGSRPAESMVVRMP